MSSSLLSGLNPEQLQAVTLPHQSALVLAGAGSGKTRVLTTRIAWLIHTGAARPGGVLAVTFTNKAAKEMLTRLSAMLPISTRGMWIGTFHGLANRLLRAHHRDAGLPEAFQILDSGDQLSVVKRVMKALSVDDERFAPRDVQYYINGHKEAGRRAKDVTPDHDIDRRLLDVYAAYDEACQREGSVDFAELLLRSHELLARNEILREHYRARFSHVLVDEFQDTNRLQYQWLKLMAGPRAAIFAVGDDDQSIYAFRGARVGNMHDLRQDYQVPNVIKLEQNYRSQGNILDAANALIANNRERLGKNLWTDAGKGEPIRVFQAPGDQDEAAFLVDEVKTLAREGVALSQMAVLYRSNAQSRVIEHALFSAGLSYRVYGGQRFFERQEVKHALAYLRLAANPHDDAALMRVINFPTRGIGARSLEQIEESARAAGTSLWAAVCAKAPLPRPGRGVEGFAALVEGLRQATAGLPLPEVVEHVIHASGLVDHYQKDREGQDRLANLEELVTAAARFAEDPSHLLDDVEGEAPAPAPVVDAAPAPDADPLLVSFLAHAALEAGDHQAEAGADALQMMTVHSAKGLEFDTVFVTGLEEGLFPHENSLNDAGGVEEERRLMYVAITRARRRLYLSTAQTRMLHGQTRYNLPSRFLGEIPAELMKLMNRAPARSARAAWPVDDEDYPAASPRPAPRAMEPAAAGGLRIGQSVRHAKFGEGVIVATQGRGADAQVQVNFGRFGMKWLLLEYARLEPA